jgi:uroporphyrinogen III methyltransferase/synthase
VIEGLRVGVTRAAHQASALGSLLTAAGAEPVFLPTLELHDPPDFGPLDGALRSLDRFDGVLFTSVNAVARTLGRLRQLGLNSQALSRMRIAAVGTATREAIEAANLSVGITASKYSSESLLEALFDGCDQGQSWLLPRALVAREVLPEGLRAAGHSVVVAPAYITSPPADPEPLRRALSNGLDAITFASGSAVKNLHTAVDGDLPRRLEGAVVASIGPITSAACRELGLNVDVEAEEARLQALVEALVVDFRVRT